MSHQDSSPISNLFAVEELNAFNSNPLNPDEYYKETNTT